MVLRKREAPYFSAGSSHDALRTCLAKVARKALETNASVHMPRIGCGLAGGKWEAVEPIIREELVSKGVSVIVYDLPRSGEKTETVSVNVRFQEYDVYCG